MQLKISAAGLAIAAMLAATTALGQHESSPLLLNYQGRLFNMAGKPVSGQLDMTFQFYRFPEGGAPRLVVIQRDVTVTDGLYSVLIGSGEVLPVIDRNLAELFQNNRDLYLGVTVEGGADELRPLIHLTSVGRAETADVSFIDSFMAVADYDLDGFMKGYWAGAGDTVDCNDNDKFVHFGAPDLQCDHYDQDCSGADRCDVKTSLDFVARLGGTHADQAHDVAVDAGGNMYLVGTYISEVDFGADLGASDIRTAHGQRDIFVTKISAISGYVWTRVMGGFGDDVATGIALDPAGYLYVAGAFGDTVNFGADFGRTDLKTSLAETDVFVVKLGTDGSYEWARRMGGDLQDEARGLAVDGAGNVYVTGFFSSVVNFQSDFGGYDAKSSAGGRDVFVTRIEANGDYGWTRRIGDNLEDVGTDIAFDGAAVWVSGYYGFHVDFGEDFGANDKRWAQGGTDAFVTKIDPLGGYLFSRRIGGPDDDAGLGIAPDGAGGVYVTGYFANDVDFAADLGGSDLKSSQGQYDGFVTRIHGDGAYGWTRVIGGLDLEGGQGVAADPTGVVYVRGTFFSEVAFAGDWGGSDAKIPFNGGNGFVTRIEPDGAYGWTRRVGQSEATVNHRIRLGASNSLYTVGQLIGTFDFGLDFAQYWNDLNASIVKTSAGGTDAYLMRIKQQ